MRQAKVILLVSIMTLLAPAVPAVEDEQKLKQCEESEINVVTDKLKVKKAFAAKAGDVWGLTLHFNVPSSINGASLQYLFLHIVGDNGLNELTTPLSTWPADENLEAMLISTRTRYKDFSLAAHYFFDKEENKCPILALLELKGNEMIEEYLACVDKESWWKCNKPESANIEKAED